MQNIQSSKMVHAALLLLMLEAVHSDLVFTISLKRSTQKIFSYPQAAGRLPHLCPPISDVSLPRSEPPLRVIPVRFGPKAIYIRRCREMTRWAKSGSRRNYVKRHRSKV
jgi:hypothetical protein